MELNNSKFIVCLKGKPHIGKSGTILELYKLLSKKATAISWNLSSPPYPQAPNPPANPDPYKTDFNVDLQYKGKHIGLDSYGDIGKVLRLRLKIWAKKNCDIIFCASRSKGEPPRDIKDFADRNGYTLIWTAPYTIETTKIPHFSADETAMHKFKAEHLEKFII
jgi:hypothetical protein